MQLGRGPESNEDWNHWLPNARQRGLKIPVRWKEEKGRMGVKGEIFQRVPGQMPDEAGLFWWQVMT